MDTKQTIDQLAADVATLRDGKWDKKDVWAIVSILGGIAGLASAAALALQGIGLL